MKIVQWLTGNRVTEQDVRDYLSRQGYRGKSARFVSLNLHAMARPGWVQVYCFAVTVKDRRGVGQDLYGVVRDDERFRTEIHLVDSPQAQSRLADELSVGLITRERRSLGLVRWLLLGVFGVASFLALLGAWLSESH